MKKKILASLLFLLLPIVGQARDVLVPFQHLKTSGAKDIVAFDLGSDHYLAIPQFAHDIPNTAAGMNVGDTDVDSLIFKWKKGKFVPYQHIPGHGNESADVFKVGDQVHLAISSVQSGPKAPYNYNTYSKVYRWDGRVFYPIQQFLGFTSKDFYGFSIGQRHFIGLANGVVLPHIQGDTTSKVYEWVDGRYVPFQDFPTKWAYSWNSFSIKGEHYLSLTDHLRPSIIYHWNGTRFVEFQSFENMGGRVFTPFKIDGKLYLAFANISHPAEIYKWNGTQFEAYQTLAGLGSRDFTFFRNNGKNYLFKTNLIHGSPQDPITKLQSQLYQWKDGKFEVVQNVTTYGGSRSAFFRIGKDAYLGVANTWSEDVRFRVDSVIYKVQ
jgi:hypothetical protein